MKVLITGASSGMGYATVKKFLKEGHVVIGIDLQPSDIEDKNYYHYIADVRDKDNLPDIESVDILINNAGCQINPERDVDTNLWGVINCTEKYGLNPNIKSILNQASVSATTGAEFPHYAAAKGGVKTYTVWTAKEIAKYGATCNSLSFGGVLTELNNSIINDYTKWSKIMSMTPLSKWADAAEAADWIYFMTVVNKSCSGQDIIIDNLESFNHTFVW